MAAGGANAVAMARRPVSRRGRRGMVDKSIVRVSGDAVCGVGTCGKEEWKKRVRSHSLPRGSCLPYLLRFNLSPLQTLTFM